MSSAETEPTPGSTGLIATPETVPASNPPIALASSSRASLETRQELAVIDESLRGSTLLFFGSAIAWLLIGSALSLLAWCKLIVPHFLTNLDWMTFGRLWPAQQDAFLYGWAGSAGIGAGLWIMSRLCRVPLRHGGVLTAAWALWNIGLLMGVVGILSGDGTSQPWLEFPRHVSPILFTAYSFIAIWAVLMFRYRREGHTYVSQWYLAAAFLWFPWIYATVNLVEFFLPVQPAAQAVVHWWYVGNLFGVWLTATALAIAYYVVPRGLHRPIHRYGLAVFGFWALLLLSSWSGLVHVIGGPIPAWMITVSIVANTLTLLPVFSILRNFTGALEGRGHVLRRTPSLRFATAGLYFFVGASVLGVCLGFRWFSEVAHFSVVTLAQEQLFLAGFVGFSLFGAIYYIAPRLLGHDWVAPDLIRWQFWLNVVGLALLMSGLLLGGFLQGLGLEDAKVPPIVIVNLLNPFLLVAGLGVLLLAISNVLFTASFLLLLVGAGRRLVLSKPFVFVSTATPSASAATAPVTVP
jgi:cytochrome c oxidase cbb3-type subunit 1